MFPQLRTSSISLALNFLLLFLLEHSANTSPSSQETQHFRVHFEFRIGKKYKISRFFFSSPQNQREEKNLGNKTKVSSKRKLNIFADPPRAERNDASWTILFEEVAPTCSNEYEPSMSERGNKNVV